MLDCSLLVGRALEHVAREDDAWPFTFTGEVHLRVACLWRLIVAGRLQLTSNDHGHPFGLRAPADGIAELTHHLSGHVVTAATVRPGTVDLTLTFGPAGTLEVITNSAGYEAWVLSSPAGIAIGQPGYE